MGPSEGAIPGGAQPDIRLEIDAGRPLPCEMRSRLNEMSDGEKQMKGFGLTTAEFVYHLPDSPSVLNSFIWQKYDLPPDFPVLFDFIDFWQREIDGRLNAVIFSHRARAVRPTDWRNVTGMFEIRGT